MKYIRLLLLTFTLLTLVFRVSYSQAGEWTWISGDTTGNHYGVYGTKGVAANGNHPGSRSGGVTWTDKSGNLWLFGGGGYLSNTYGEENDLWKYDIASNEWTWEAGDSVANQNGIYGSKGVPAPANKPGGREGAVTWVDTAGNLWLFAGEGYPSTGTNSWLDDMWQYNIVTNQWTWITGDSTINNVGVYGTKKVPSASNKPGCRWKSSSWTDSAGIFWLLGGFCVGGGNLNDLWKYDITKNQWTWISGDALEVSGVFGTKGVFATGNKPGGRQGMASWIDRSGNFWVFGGYGPDITLVNNIRNDLWEYNPVIDQWAWMSGDTVSLGAGVYGTEGVPAPQNQPANKEYAATWLDLSGNLWLFGGYTGSMVEPITDLWKYTLANNEWEWVGGDSVIRGFGIYGTEGTPDSANRPGSRAWPAYWTDNSGNFWLYGGEGFGSTQLMGGFLNDLWTFTSAIHVPVANFIANRDTVCMGSQVAFTDQSTASPRQWKWVFNGGTPDTSSNQNPTIAFDTAGTYSVTLLAANTSGSDSLTKTAYITVLASPVPVATAADTIICSGDSTQVCTSTTFASYLWNTGDTTFCTSATVAGGYWLTVTDANGCSAISNHAGVSVYPVPSVSIIHQGDTLSSFGQAHYQWILNGHAISNATGALYIATGAGSYTVQVIDSNGCSATSEAVVISGISPLQPGGGPGVSIFPNPFTNTLFISVDELAYGIDNISMYDVLGRMVLNREFENSPGSPVVLDVSALQKGAYYIRIKTGLGESEKCLVKSE